MRFRPLLIAPWLVVLACAGCQRAPRAGPTTAPAQSQAPTSAPTGLSPADVKVEVVDGDGYQAVLDKHKGQVVLVDFWATWCEPCRENFPHIVTLHHKHQADGLRVIGFSSDELSAAEEVRQFLAEHGAAFDNLQTKFGISTQTNDTFDIHGVPYYKLYDRRGELRYQFAGGHEDLEHGEPIENIDRRVAELLAESA